MIFNRWIVEFFSCKSIVDCTNVGLSFHNINFGYRIHTIVLREIYTHTHHTHYLLLYPPVIPTLLPPSPYPLSLSNKPRSLTLQYQHPTNDKRQMYVYIKFIQIIRKRKYVGIRTVVRRTWDRLCVLYRYLYNWSIPESKILFEYKSLTTTQDLFSDWIFIKVASGIIINCLPVNWRLQLQWMLRTYWFYGIFRELLLEITILRTNNQFIFGYFNSKPIILEL